MSEVQTKKKSSKTILLIILAAVVVLVGIYAFINMSGRGITATEPAAQVAQVIRNNGCIQCHMVEPEPVWYAGMPGVSGTLQRDIEVARRFVTFDDLLMKLDNGEQIPEVYLNKIETATKNGSMPIDLYKMVHWGSDLNQQESDIVLSFVSDQRAQYYSNGLAAPEFANEPVEPLPDVASMGVNAEKAALGLDLYHDTRLSADRTISCASCHALDNWGQDSAPTSRGIGSKVGGINAPTTYNSVFNVQQFWNGREPDLQGQAGGPPLNPIEMGWESFDQIVAILSEDEEMVARFEAVYPGEGITKNSITDAIAEFEKGLVTPNSPFDKYLKGQADALTAEQIDGYELFKKYTCASCHVGEAMGGQSFEIMGITENGAKYFEEIGKDVNPDNVGLTDDLGTYSLTENPDDMFRFKVPTLRNIAETGPYMHDGRQFTLDDAVRFMFKYQTATQNPDQATVDKIVAFLESLTGENEYTTYANVPSNDQ